MRDYRKYEIWHKAHELVVEVYRYTTSFPKEERYNLCNQLRRATISIPTNIVEGSARKSDRDFLRFLFISAGSAAETECLIYL
jgi:four helix bundle protein